MAPSRVMAVVKADAYGHGLVELARAANDAGVDFLGVLDIETGLALRKAGIETPAFAWLHSPSSDFAGAVRSGIDLSAGSLAELELIAKAPGRAQVHLKIDTGLSRNGCRAELWKSFVQRALELGKSGEIDVVAIWSHLSGTSTADDTKALTLFETAVVIAKEFGFDGYLHIASSPAAFALPESRYDMVRIGVSAFGTSPLTDVSASNLGLDAPMSVTAEVISDGVISIGFLHGYFSKLEGLAHVEINGKLYLVKKIGPLASAIDSGDYEPGDEVRIFGREVGLAPSAEELCNLVGTVTDELFTGLKANLTTYSS
jgi:alanine racemase